ncbi:MAG: metalloregulator ArsR/SmtB family transcription factor [Wenzhouxiangellaceae bacterium]
MEVFDVIADPVRRRILERLAEGERTSGELVAFIRDEFGISQAAVSQHLRVLRESGFATVRPEGTRRIYAVDGGPLRNLDRWLSRFRDHWEPRLDALATEVARGKHKRRKARNAQCEQDKRTTVRKRPRRASGSSGR